jgi:hypothetical protein
MIATVTICAALTFTAPPATLSNAVEREAARLAKDPAKATRQDAAWARVRSLKAGTEILLSTRPSIGERRYFLSADQTTLNVLNLSKVPLSGDPIDRLLKIAASQPELLVAPAAGQSRVDGPLEIRSDSVTYKGRVIASIGQLVETVSRADVTSVERPSQGSVSAGTTALVGAAICGAIGYALAASQKPVDVSPGAIGVLIFAPIGAGIGFVAGSLAETHSSRPIVIYRQ